jgi:hypothetical protein
MLFGGKKSVYFEKIGNLMRLNLDHLIELSVTGEINHPTLKKTGYVINSSGKVEVYPSVGGISYNVRIGDPAVGWMADHVEPGVSIINSGKAVGEYSPNAALNVLASVGNQAKIISGDAKGEHGYVTGKHGGINHVLVDFEPEVLEKLTIGDKVQIKSIGVGLRLLDFYPDILVMNCDPKLLNKMNIQHGDKLKVGVTHILPVQLIGSGIGSSSAYSGDVDIQIFDETAVKQYKLNSLRFGDFVAIMNTDASYGWIYKENAITIGVIVHSSSVISGHGPGVTTIMTSKSGRIVPDLDSFANLKNYIY